ncbi:MAG: hypothetical protein VW886_07100 [Candidatus Heimdallarchaeota archaeon]
MLVRISDLHPTCSLSSEEFVKEVFGGLSLSIFCVFKILSKVLIYFLGNLCGGWLNTLFNVSSFTGNLTFCPPTSISCGSYSCGVIFSWFSKVSSSG